MNKICLDKQIIVLRISRKRFSKLVMGEAAEFAPSRSKVDEQAGGQIRSTQIVKCLNHVPSPSVDTAFNSTKTRFSTNTSTKKSPTITPS